MWTVSSVGRALDSRPKGRLFESGTVHKLFGKQNVVSLLFEDKAHIVRECYIINFYSHVYPLGFRLMEWLDGYIDFGFLSSILF